MKNQISQKAETDKKAEVKRLEEQQQDLKAKLDDLNSGNTENLDIKFVLPSVDFDRNLVRGRIIRLFTIREDKYARALEEVAGGRLYSVVVETDAVATVMLKKRCFRHREVLIPNNKISGRDVPKELTDYVT